MENVPRNDGQRLRDAMRQKGFDMKGLAKALNVSRAIVEKDIQRDTISRRTLVKYIPILFEGIDQFYKESESIAENVRENSSNIVVSVDYKELLNAKDEIIKEQRKHIETLTAMLHFFPNAVQQGLITA